VDHRHAQLEQIVSASALLGYLNFSDGRPDPRWQKQVNDAYTYLAEHGEAEPWLALLDWLAASLHSLHAGDGAAFRDVTQAENVLALVGRVLPAYRHHHADLLSRQLLVRFPADEAEREIEMESHDARHVHMGEVDYADGHVQ